MMAARANTVCVYVMEVHVCVRVYIYVGGERERDGGEGMRW